MLSKIGEWIGKVRSTPTPKETLRTVKVRPTPEPWSLITTPWKTWIRERLPSTTLTCTLMVSPARKSGTSSRLVSLDRSSMIDMVSPRDCHRSPTDWWLLVGGSQHECRWVVPLWQVTAAAGPRSDFATGVGVRRNRATERALSRPPPLDQPYGARGFRGRAEQPVAG